MADKKITDMAVMAAGTQATDDVLAVVDISEINANNKNKKITIENLFTDIPATVRTSANSNVAIGVTPPTWSTAYKVLQAGAASLVGQAAGDGSTSNYSNNAYFDTTDNRWEYIGDDDASQITQSDGKIIFKRAASGTANSAITWSESMRIDSSGRLLVGTSAYAGNGRLVAAGNTGGPAGTLDITWTGNRPTAANTDIGYIRWYVAENSSANAHYASIHASSDGPSSGTGDIPGRLVFSTTADGASSPTERMRIDSSGRLLIGLSSAPAGSSGNLAKLIVQGYVGAGGNTGVGIISLQRAEGETNVAPGDELGRVTFADDTGDHFAFISGVCDGPTSASSAANDNPGRIEFWTSPDGSGAIAERMRINGSGSVGIGTTVPSGYLDIGGGGTGTTGLSVRGGGSGYSTLFRYGANEDNYIAQGASGTTIFRNVENKNLLQIHSSGQCVLGTVGNTATAGSTVDLTIRMTPATSAYGIYSSNFSSGTTAAPAGYGVYGHMGGLPPSGSGQYGVYGKVDTYSTRASGGILGYSINNQVFGIVAYWSTAAYYGFYTNGSVLAAGGFTQSDSRLKDIVQHGLGTGVLDKVCALQAKKFTWKDNTLQRRGNERVQIGFIAQDLQADFPEIVNEDFNGRVTGVNPETLNEQLGTTLSVDYGKLVPILVEALKEAKDRIETLETKVTALEAG